MPKLMQVVAGVDENGETVLLISNVTTAEILNAELREKVGDWARRVEGHRDALLVSHYGEQVLYVSGLDADRLKMDVV